MKAGNRVPPAAGHRHRATPWAALVCGLMVAGCRNPAGPTTPVAAGASAAATDHAIEQFCSSCHVMPSPTIFPKSRWRNPVTLGYQLAEAANRDMSTVPGRNAAHNYFTQRAPDELPLPPPGPLEGPPAHLRRRAVGLAGRPPRPGVSHVRFAKLSPPHESVLLVCDMRASLILMWDPKRPEQGLRAVSSSVPHPAAAVPVDLDRDGFVDLLAADLGTYLPSNQLAGRVVWLRRDPASQRYDTIIIAAGLGRVADVQAADFDGDADLDLVVAAFGWRNVGDLRYYENRTSDWSNPQFREHVLEAKTGAIHLPVCDLNRDGRPDFVALFSQEHEAIIAFLNEGHGRFRQRLVFAAANPAFGSTGIEVVDIDGDGDSDVLYSNGDSLDDDLVRPYHGIHWLENTGEFPFRHHFLATMPGVHRALARDVDGDGDNDVVAAAFLPVTQSETYDGPPLDALIWLERRDGQFVRHSLERGRCGYTTLEVADIDADRDLDWVTGVFAAGRMAMGDWIRIWENATPAH